MQEERTTQERAPLWEALTAHAAGRRARFHVPAHGGRFQELRRLVGPGVRYDLTELDDLDDLHAPSGPIAEAERLAATSTGADAAHFLVGGTSAGIQALLLAATRPGAKVVVGRDSHKSVVAGLILAGGDPVYISPRLDIAAGRSLGIPAGAVEAALSANPGAAACQLTNPNYYGIQRDYAAVFQRHRTAMLVDEAHGAHRYFERDAAGGALAAGADGAALSLHKSGLALTQSAIVIVKGPAVDRARLRAALRLLQSTSPSYLLMAGLDLGRREMALRGPELIAQSRERRRRLADAINGIKGLSVWAPSDPEVESEHPLRLMIDVTRLGITGWQAAEFLAERGVDTELADFGGVLTALGIYGSDAQDRRLIAGLRALAREGRGTRQAATASHWPALYGIPRKRAMSPREAFFAASGYVPLSEAAGRIAAEAVCPYPPGVPLVVPGEIITGDDCDTVRAILRAGGKVQGVDPAGRICAVN